MLQEIERRDGTKVWHKNGKRHREDGPAVEYPDGTKEWYRNGVLHREDGPAVMYAGGGVEWYRNGIKHREDGPAHEHPNGAKMWYNDGKRHREDGPAIEWADGTEEWYKNGQRHREDGPAVEHENGDKEWWINGKQISVSLSDRDRQEKENDVPNLWKWAIIQNIKTKEKSLKVFYDDKSIQLYDYTCLGLYDTYEEAISEHPDSYFYQNPQNKEKIQEIVNIITQTWNANLKNVGKIAYKQAERNMKERNRNMNMSQQENEIIRCRLEYIRILVDTYNNGRLPMDRILIELDRLLQGRFIFDYHIKQSCLFVKIVRSAENISLRIDIV